MIRRATPNGTTLAHDTDTAPIGVGYLGEYVDTIPADTRSVSADSRTAVRADWREVTP